jgi:ribosomal protein L40E
MPQNIGFIKMEWVCPQCNTRNPGPIKTCQGCGAPQPENVKFEMGAQQDFVQDEKEIQQAQKGADIHCGFCGTRNPADAKACSQCGGDLAEGKKREAGQLIERSAANAPQPVACPNCGFSNASSSANCGQCGAPLTKSAPAAVESQAVVIPTAAKKGLSPKTIILIVGAILAFILICCAGIWFFALPGKSVTGTVDSIHWQTVASVEEVKAVEYNDEAGSPPSGAYDVSCQDKSEEVCEEKTIDKGNGYAEVVKDCHTETTTYCSYTVDEWQVIQSYPREGNDLNPLWDSPLITAKQRRGRDTATYTVLFTSSEGDFTYNPTDIIEYQKYEVGSQWTLILNRAGGLLSVEPVK